MEDTKVDVVCEEVKEEICTDISEEVERRRKCTCISCQSVIEDEYIMRVVNRSWHASCLRCSDCNCQLKSTCHVKFGHLYCHQHYNSHGSVSRCSTCAKVIDDSEIIQKSANYLYHVSCFHCMTCGEQIEKGDKYYRLESGNLMCRTDYETAQRKAEYDNGNKRPRTTITTTQLETLKKAYRKSSKPPRHVREGLAKQTGLESRVVQVWFQNRRAKEKRVTKDHKNGGDTTNYESVITEASYVPPICLPTAHSTWPPFLPLPGSHQFTFQSQATNLMDVVHNFANTSSAYDLHMTSSI